MIDQPHALDSCLTIRLLERDDIVPIAAAFAALGWNKPASQYEQYLAEQQVGERVVLVALIDGDFAGYVTIVWHSHYPPFAAANIPEVVDFNVLPHYRRRGIGSRLMDEAERRIGERSAIAGIGVGLYRDYGPAQRMYVLRGYVPDSRGVYYDTQQVRPGQAVSVDDSLALFFTKELVEALR
ncbi:MAG: GNAT family N-acetyltransferase [Caldilineaceae bacterium]